MRASLAQLDLPQIDSSGRLSGTGRSEGVHLSQVIKWVRDKTEGPMRDTGNSNFMTMGFLLEVIIERGFKLFGHMMRTHRANIIRPGEHELDGIFCSPDGLDGEVLEEYKCTYKSLGRLFGTNPDKGDCGGDVEQWLREHHWWWLVQIMAYCWVMATTRARLIALFVNGDYSHKPPYGGPQLVVVDLEFTYEETESCWKNILIYRDQMIEEGKS